MEFEQIKSQSNDIIVQSTPKPAQEAQSSQSSLNKNSTQQTQPNLNNQQQELITDFSSIFKSKGRVPTLMKPNRVKNGQASKVPNWLLQIPTKLDITLEDINKRRVMDQRKWMSVTKANIKKAQENTENISNVDWRDKIIAGVCSCWNYLYSQKGLGKEKFMNVNKFVENIGKQVNLQEEAKQLNQYNRFEFINKIINAWSRTQQNQLKLKATIEVKLAEPNKVQSEAQNQKQILLQSLSSNTCSYIYLSYEDIFLPIGFDITSLKPIEAYSKFENILPQNQQLWIVSSTLGRNEPTFAIKRWSDIRKDLETVWPQYFNIKEHKQGIRMRKYVTQQNKGENRGTSNCIIRIDAINQ